MDLIAGSGRSPGGGHGNPLQYSCLENPMDRGDWWATLHGVTKSQNQAKPLSTQDFKGKFPIMKKTESKESGKMLTECPVLCVILLHLSRRYRYYYPILQTKAQRCWELSLRQSQDRNPALCGVSVCVVNPLIIWPLWCKPNKIHPWPEPNDETSLGHEHLSSSLLSSHWEITFDSSWPRGLQHARLPCPSLSPGICSRFMAIELVMLSNHLLKDPWCWERLKAKGEGSSRGCDG